MSNEHRRLPTATTTSIAASPTAAQVLGDEWVDRSLAGASEFNADFQSLITRYAWHDIWGRPGLDHETRRLLVLGMTMGMARWEEFELHCRARGPRRRAGRQDQGDAAAGRDLLRRSGREHRVQDRRRDPARRRPCAGAAIARRTIRAWRRTTRSARRSCASRCKGRARPSSSAMRSASTCTCGTSSRRAWRRRTRVLRYDHRGHGESARPPGPYAIDDLVDDAARVIREWGRGPVAFVGLSMGGMVGQGLAVRHPELLRGAVLANTVARYPEAARPTWAARIAASRRAAWPRSPMGSSSATSTPTIAPRTRRSPQRCASGSCTPTPPPTSPRCHAVANVDWLDRLATVRVPDARPRRRARRRRDAGDGEGDRRADRRRRAARLRRRIAPERGRGRRRIPRRGIVVPRLAAAALTRRATPLHGHCHEQSIRLPGRPRRQEGHLHQALRQRLRVHRRGRSRTPASSSATTR